MILKSSYMHLEVGFRTLIQTRVYSQESVFISHLSLVMTLWVTRVLCSGSAHLCMTDHPVWVEPLNVTDNLQPQHREVLFQDLSATCTASVRSEKLTNLFDLGTNI
ncbi:hypothetical protein J6590_002047 [Homalodisca vitripennis]|nr:hypothetical protein J6590_002047 [Homalodisca vitripennis]